jgi:hypothetical protein
LGKTFSEPAGEFDAGVVDRSVIKLGTGMGVSFGT